jgi:hypothetical protein
LRDLRLSQRCFGIFVSLLGSRCPFVLKPIQYYETSGNNSATDRQITEDINPLISFSFLFIPLTSLYINSRSAFYCGLSMKYFIYACCSVPVPIPSRAHCVVTFSEGHNRQLRASLICGIIFFIVIHAWQGDSFFVTFP